MIEEHGWYYLHLLRDLNVMKSVKVYSIHDTGSARDPLSLALKLVSILGSYAPSIFSSQPGAPSLRSATWIPELQFSLLLTTPPDWA